MPEQDTFDNNGSEQRPIELYQNLSNVFIRTFLFKEKKNEKEKDFELYELMILIYRRQFFGLKKRVLLEQILS